MAEYAVYNFLVEKDRVVTQPDIMIYSVKRKSFDADLFVDEKTPIHVKSCKRPRKLLGISTYRQTRLLAFC
jgi:hypothetical protein